MAVHELKTWPEPFSAVLAGVKNFEVRVSDRQYAIGDTVVLHEYDPVIGNYTGRRIIKHITYIIRPGEWGLPDNICVFGWSAIKITDGVDFPKNKGAMLHL